MAEEGTEIAKGVEPIHDQTPEGQAASRQTPGLTEERKIDKFQWGGKKRDLEQERRVAGHEPGAREQHFKRRERERLGFPPRKELKRLDVPALLVVHEGRRSIDDSDLSYLINAYVSQLRIPKQPIYVVHRADARANFNKSNVLVLHTGNKDAASILDDYQKARDKGETTINGVLLLIPGEKGNPRDEQDRARLIDDLERRNINGYVDFAPLAPPRQFEKTVTTLAGLNRY